MTSGNLHLRVLVVDDLPAMRDSMHYILSEHGDEVVTAASAKEASVQLEQGRWDLVVLDKNLDGPDGTGEGLDLLEEVNRFNPGCPVIIVTGYADPASVERAFQRGAFDYLEKGGIFETVLRLKARQALAPARERRLSALQNGNREDAIAALWSQVERETDSSRKGALLENLLTLLLRSIPGFEETTTRLRSEDEELDLWIPNQSSDPFWQKESPYILGECKHWSKPVDRKEADAFFGKLERRRARCRLGLFIALGGVTAGFRKVVEEHRREDKLVVILTKSELDALITASDRNATLKAFHSQASISAD